VFKGMYVLKSLDNVYLTSVVYNKFTAGKFVKPGSSPDVDLGFP